jgi:IPT/TIG domain
MRYVSPKVNQTINMGLKFFALFCAAYLCVSAIIYRPADATSSFSLQTSQERKISDRPGTRRLQVRASSAAPNSTVTVPILFHSEGDENSLSYSLSFNPAHLSDPQVSLGSDAAGASLLVNTSQVEQGYLGVQLTLPGGQRLLAGSREIVRVDFAIKSGAGASLTTIDFTDQPVARRIVDSNGSSVEGNFAAGAVIVVPGFEGDVNPRPLGNGDGRVTISDWMQTGLFVAGIEKTADGSEFQRADSAPKDTRGNGRLTIADWVMAGRYAAGLESPIEAGGPTAVARTLAESGVQILGQGRVFRIVEDTFQRGRDSELKFEIISQGNENAIGFSINFDRQQINYIRAELGSDSSGAVLNVNTDRLSEGRLGVALALPAGQTFTPGVRQLVKIIFAVPPSSSVNSTIVSFGDLPVEREIVDAGAASLPSTYIPALIRFDPPVNLVPILTRLNPNPVVFGGPSFTLTVIGANFVEGVVVLANNVPRVTQLINSTEVRATILAEDISEVGTLSITAQNPSPGGGTSGAIDLLIVNPVPTLTTIDPNFAAVGGPSFTLTANGANFVPGAVVQWNGSDRTTTFVNNTRLTAQIPAADIQSVSTALVRVLNPAPGGGASATLEFAVRTPNPLPRITSITPDSIFSGSPAFTLTVNGTNFTPSSSVRLNGNALQTTFVNGSQLAAQVLAESIATAGTVTISVLNPPPGGGTSNSVLLTISSQPNPLPVLMNISPSTVLAGGPAFTLTVNGSGFVGGSVIQFNNEDRPTTFVSATQITTQVPAADIATTGQASIRVVNPQPGGGTSNVATLVIVNPLPAIANISPNIVPVGNPTFTLTVNGTGFVSGSEVRVNGSPRETSIVNNTQLTARIPLTDTTAIGTLNVQVVNPLPGGGVSNTLPLQVIDTNPLPRIIGISPASVNVGSPGFTLVVNGASFLRSSVVRVNNQDRPTEFISDSSLGAQIPASDIAAPGELSIVVFNPAPGGGRSNAVTLTVINPNPTSVITALSPNPVLAGGPSFTLTVGGTGFVSGSVIRFNGQDRQTTFVSSTQLTATILAADIANGGAGTITVINPPPGGGSSNPATLTINNPLPVLVGLNPASVPAGNPAFTLRINGAGFVPSSIVRWNGSNRQTTFVNSTQLTIEVPASDVTNTGSATIDVTNPAPAGGTSNSLTFSIGQPPILVPVLDNISPDRAKAGSPGFTLTVNGSNFVPGATVLWNGSVRQTAFISSTQLTAVIPASDITTSGSAVVTVVNPLSSSSNFLIFTILE